MSPERRIDITIPSTYGGIDLVRGVLASVRDKVPLPNAVLLKVEICVVEAIGNSIRHAYDLKPDGVILVSILLGEDRLVVEVGDEGRTMPPEAQDRMKNGPPLADPDTLSVQEIPEGGMGFPIMRSVLDAVSYETAQGRNTLRMTMKHPSSVLSPE